MRKGKNVKQQRRRELRRLPDLLESLFGSSFDITVVLMTQGGFDHVGRIPLPDCAKREYSRTHPCQLSFEGP
jgi:hypothetical protein